MLVTMMKRVMLVILAVLTLTSAQAVFPSNSKLNSVMDLRMKNVSVNKDDQYLCTSYRMPVNESYIVQFEPLANANTAHHILLFGCSEPYNTEEEGAWSCRMICRGEEQILFAWARNAPELVLPKDVGFKVGGPSKVKYIVVQIHYAKALPSFKPTDQSGIRLYMTQKRQRYEAGIFLLLAYSLTIPPNTPKTSADISCSFTASGNIYPFGFRAHAHSLGRVISGYHVNKSNSYHMIGKGNPQWPQSFYPVSEQVVVKPGDKLVGRCTYNSTGRQRSTMIGPTAADEMCNFYIMYYKEVGTQIPFPQCVGNNVPSLIANLPPGSDEPLPYNATLEAAAHGHGSHMQGHEDPDPTITDVVDTPTDSGKPGLQHYVNFQSDFMSDNSQTSSSVNGLDYPIGQVGGVATDNKGGVYVFHRGNRVWDGRSFNFNNVFQQQNSPIEQETIITYDKNSNILRKFGKNMFYMPHGITVDQNYNIWVTDVGLHQVMRFPPGSDTPDLTLGVKFQPGNDNTHFCKPADVAVLSTGEFFVADGYCNSRIMKFSSDGTLLKTFGNNLMTPQADGYPPEGSFDIPHSLTIAEDKGLLCVADRENGRIQCFDFNGNFQKQIHPPEFGPRLFAIEYCPLHDGLLFAVNGPPLDNSQTTVQGFIIDINTGKLSESWNTQDGLRNPHDVAVDPNNLRVYVGELNPSKVWRFDMMGDSGSIVTDKPLTTPGPGNAGTTSANTPVGSSTTDISEPEVAKGTLQKDDTVLPAVIIGVLLVIPVVIIVVVVIVVRVYKNGKHDCCGRHRSYSSKKFNLGNFLSPHRGFDRLSTDESDHEIDLSDSDQEEYSITQKA